LGLTHEPAARLGKVLVDIAPPGLARVFYSDNGATSVEVALKMAFQYGAHRGEHRPEYLALEGSYHGDTLGAVSVGGIAAFHKTFRPLLFKSHFAPAPHCFRCPFRKSPPQPELRTGEESPAVRAPRPGEARGETGCRWECLQGAEKILKARGHRLAAAIVEPVVQGASGMRVMPKGYLKGFERLCRKYNVLWVADEVATGFGRTGRMFAVEQEDVRPDFLCVAKALTGGYLPLAATLTTQKIYRAFLGRYDEFKTFFHGHSYTANPLACAVALENLAVFKRERTLERLKEKRRWLTDFLKEVAVLPGVGHVRQAGFMAGIELVKNKSTGQPHPVLERRGARMCRALLKKGVWLRPLGDVLVILPPLSIPRRDWTRLADGLRVVLSKFLSEP
jgi:adenosylmethionine-8-amino-7-oxononanoate aminotransferase